MEEMIRRILPLFVLVVHVAVMTAAEDPQRSLIWKVTPPTGASSYVFGTIHVPDTTVFRQRDTVLSLLRTCTTFAAELHLDSAAANMDASMLFLPKGTLYDLTDSATVREICSVLAERSPSMAVLCPRLSPGALSMILTMADVTPTAPVAMDQFLWDLAGKAGAHRVGLEALSEQKALLDRFTPAMVLDQVRDMDVNDSLFDQLVDVYASEDLAAMAELASDPSLNMLDDVMAEFNDDRNVRMVERMEPLLRNGRAFVAVGALHLTGPKSILLLLRSKGYTVEPVLGGTRSMWIPIATR